jgi:hypothetical protein
VSGESDDRGRQLHSVDFLNHRVVIQDPVLTRVEHDFELMVRVPAKVGCAWEPVFLMVDVKENGLGLL